MERTIFWPRFRNWNISAGFVSLTEALDLPTPAGGAMPGLLAIFAEFEREILRRELVRACLMRGQMGNTESAGDRGVDTVEVRKLHRAGLSKSEIARCLKIGRTSVRRILATDSFQK